MSFDAYAVASRWGPHVTLQAAAVHLGRHWTTTTRRSAKALAVGRTGRASATSVGDDGSVRIVAGRARVLDAGRPATLLADPVGLALVPGAMARLIGAQIDQVAGYAEVGAAVPSAWLPWGRVVLATDVGHRIDVDRRGCVRTRRWPAASAAATLRAPASGTGRGPVELPTGVPEAARRLVDRPGPCWVGVETSAGVVALPGSWQPSTGRVEVAPALADALGARRPGPVCVTFDDSAERRPDRKVGCMLRGVVDGGGAITARRVTWWVGFSSGTEHVFDAHGTVGP